MLCFETDGLCVLAVYEKIVSGPYPLSVSGEMVPLNGFSFFPFVRASLFGFSSFVAEN